MLYNVGVDGKIVKTSTNTKQINVLPYEEKKTYFSVAFQLKSYSEWKTEWKT